MHGPTEIFFLLATVAKCNELLIIYCIFSTFLYLWGRRRTPTPAAYSHDSVAKQWSRYSETPGSKPCLCAILVLFCEALIIITVSYDGCTDFIFCWLKKMAIRLNRLSFGQAVIYVSLK